MEHAMDHAYEAVYRVSERTYVRRKAQQTRDSRHTEPRDHGGPSTSHCNEDDVVSHLLSPKLIL